MNFGKDNFAAIDNHHFRGARHGHKMSAKLARIEAMEQKMLTQMKGKDKEDKTEAENEQKTKKRKKNKEEEVENEASKPKKSKKKKKKHAKE